MLDLGTCLKVLAGENWVLGGRNASAIISNSQTFPIRCNSCNDSAFNQEKKTTHSMAVQSIIPKKPHQAKPKAKQDLPYLCPQAKQTEKPQKVFLAFVPLWSPRVLRQSAKQLWQRRPSARCWSSRCQPSPHDSSFANVLLVYESYLFVDGFLHFIESGIKWLWDALSTVGVYNDLGGCFLGPVLEIIAWSKSVFGWFWELEWFDGALQNQLHSCHHVQVQ